MTIVYHHRTLGDGAEGIHVKEMVAAFRDMGQCVVVIGPVGELGGNASSKAKALGGLKRMVPRVCFELLEVCYSFYAFVITAAAIIRHRPSFVYDRYIAFNIGTLAAARLFRVPYVLEVNAPLALERAGERDEGLVLTWLASIVERLVCNLASRVIVVSTPLKNYLESVGVRPGVCTVMPNGVNPNVFVPRTQDETIRLKYQIPADSVVLGFTGVLREWHGLDLLVDALALISERFDNVHVLIVGDGPYRSALTTYVENKRLTNRVHITGRIPYIDVPSHIGAFDIAVSPRATFYASPMKVVEYMALQKPVVVPNTANFLDLVSPGETAICFDAGDFRSLSEAICQLINSNDLRQQISRNARLHVEKRLNWAWNAQTTCELVKSIGK